MNPGVLGTLAALFAGLSLIAVGGANAVIPDMHRALVDAHGLVSNADFALLVALGQAAPGPNVMVVGLLGWHIAGAPGAVVCTVAMCGPSSILAVAARRASRRALSPGLRRLALATLAPVTAGLVLGSGYTLTLAAGASAVIWALAAGAVAVLLAFPKLNPLVALFGAGAIGILARL